MKTSVHVFIDFFSLFLGICCTLNIFFQTIVNKGILHFLNEHVLDGSGGKPIIFPLSFFIHIIPAIIIYKQNC